MLQVTQGAQRIEQESARLTEGAEIRAHEQYMLELESLPLEATITAQELEIARSMVHFEKVRATRTAYAPEHETRVIDAEMYESFARLRLVSGYAVAVALLLFVVVLVTRYGAIQITAKARLAAVDFERAKLTQAERDKWGADNKDLEPYKDSELGVSVTIIQREKPIRKIAPCSRIQLNEFVDRVTLGDVTLRLNNWEGSKTSWTQIAFKEFRNNFLASFGLAFQDAQTSHYKLTEAGEYFAKYISQKNPSPPLVIHLPSSIPFPVGPSHESESSPGGEVVQ